MLGMYATRQLQTKFNAYSQIPIRSGMTGVEVAKQMLHDHGIYDVKFATGKAMLSDHYNPLTKTIQLSPEVYHGRSVASAAVAAHECGHAVQHATSYSMLMMRSALVPIVKIASMAQQFGLLAALVMISTFPSLLFIVIISFIVTTIFALITLPVEFDASRRALAWLEKSQLVHGEDYDQAKDALKWAAMTYLVAALSSFLMLIFLILAFKNRK